MGGFEGGDEAGYWDVVTPPTSKVVQNGTKKRDYIQREGSIYTIEVYDREGSLHDTVSFVTCRCEAFTVDGIDKALIESSSVYKAYRELLEYTSDSDIEEYFHEHKIVMNSVNSIQESSQLSASYTAAFLLLSKEVCSLVLSSDELTEIADTIGSEVSLFIENYRSV